MLRQADLPPRVLALCQALNADWRPLFPSETPSPVAEALLDASLANDANAFRAAAGDVVVRDGYRRVRLVDWARFDALHRLTARARDECNIIDGQIRELQERRANLVALVG